MIENNTVKSEHDPVSPDEKVLRRIPKGPPYYEPGLLIPIQRLAFHPTKKDIDGLSIFRALFTGAAEVAASGRSAKGYAVARLLVETINELSLSVIPKPLDDQLSGHSLIPELNYIDKEKNKKSGDQETKERFKELTFNLAKIASRDILLE